MEDKNLSANDIALGSLLTGNRGGGYGYGGGGAWGGGGYGSGHGSFAGPGSNAVRMDRNAQVIEDQNDCTRSVLGGAIDNMNNSFESVARQGQFNELKDGQFRSELRNGDRLRDIENTIAANAKEAAQCCCDAKLENCKQHSELLAEIKAVEARGIQRDLDTVTAELTQLKTINALRENGHGSH